MTGADADDSSAATPERPATEDLEERLAATEGRLLRTLADLDNLRKRVARDMERERSEYRKNVLLDWLEVVDGAERALAAFADRPDDPVYTGLAALAAQMNDVLRRQGVERVGEAGEPFDPERHEAMGSMSDAGVPPGALATVVRPGYALGGRLLRPAQVIVASP
jgi:molecular chaperone GrpE